MRSTRKTEIPSLYPRASFFRKEFSLCFLACAHDIDYTVPLLLDTGIRWIQFREKQGTKRELYSHAERLRMLTDKYHALYIVNDYADIALAVEADGVHLGQDDLPLAEAKMIMQEKLVGISTHSLAQAQEAEKGGADYIGFGPIFSTLTKDAGVPKGPEAIKEIKASVGIPVIGIGGIKKENAAAVFEAGADGVAVASGLTTDDIRGNAEEFIRIIQKCDYAK